MSEEVYSIPLVKLAQEFSLEEIVIPDNYNDILITTPEISRPGLLLPASLRYLMRSASR